MAKKQPIKSFESHFDTIRRQIQEEEKKGRALTQIEEQEMQDGFSLSEMVNTPGWQVMKSWLENLAHHSWVDPRGTTKEEWEWQEINAFHASNNAKELLENVTRAIDRSHYLLKVRSGEIKTERMRI